MSIAVEREGRETVKTQKRSYTVEIKQGRRGTKDGPRSIWNNVDLAAATAHVMKDEAEATAHTDRPARKAEAPPSYEPANPPRILPALPRPETSEDPTHPEDVPVVDKEPEIPDIQGESHSSSEMHSAKRWVRRTRSRRSIDKPLPAGQRWKRRLPRILR